MNSEREQLQALITEIDGVLRKMSSRMAWWMSGDTRQILERVRNYLVDLEEKIPTQPSDSSAAERNSIASDRGQLAPTGETQATAAWQALVGEMNSLRTQLMQPMVSDLTELRSQREILIKEIRDLERRKQHDYSLAQQQANQQKIISEFLHILMGRLQESLSQSVSQVLGHIESQVLAYESGDRPGTGALGGDYRSSMGDRFSAQSRPNNPLLDPQERLDHLRMLQAQSDELLLTLDSNLRVIFDAVKRNVHAYQDSMLQELEKMQRLGQQNDAMFSRLVYHLAQELGQDAPTYLESSLKLTEAENRQAESPESPSSPKNRASLFPSPSLKPFSTQKSQPAGESPDPDSAPQLENDDIETLLNTEIASPIGSELPESAIAADDDDDYDILTGLKVSDRESEQPTDEPPAAPRSLDRLTDLIDDIDLPVLSVEETTTTDSSASTSTDDEPGQIPVASDPAEPESLLVPEDQPIDRKTAELSIDTNTLQQLSEDLLNLEALEAIEDAADEDNTDSPESWGWGEEIADESPSDLQPQPTEISASTPEPAEPPSPVTESESDEDDMFGSLSAESPTPEPAEPPSPVTEDDDDEDMFGSLSAESSPEPAEPPSPVIDDEDEDMFGNLGAESPTPEPAEPAEPPIETQSAVDSKSSQKPKTPSNPPLAISKAELDDLTLDEIFADLVAASPPPANSFEKDDWVEIDEVDSPTPAVAAESPSDPANSSVDDFFAGFDDSSLDSEDVSSSDDDSEDESDLESWLSDPVSELDLESESGSDSNLDDFFAKLSDRTSISAVPSDEDLFG